MLAGNNFTENFNADVFVEIFPGCLKQYPQLFLLANLLLKVIGL